MQKTFLSVFLLLSCSLMAQQQTWKDSIVTRTETVHYQWVDTLMTTQTLTDTLVHHDTLHILPDTTGRGWYVRGFIGGGYGSLNYKLNNGRALGQMSGLVELQAAYFFHPNWGVGLGLNFLHIGANASLKEGSTYQWIDVKDSEGDVYTHITRVNAWREQQTSYRLSVPVTIEMMYPVSHWTMGDVRIAADLGLEASMQVARTYETLQSNLTHTGYYNQWHLNLYDVHEFYTHSPEYKGNWSNRTSLGVLAGVGVWMPLAKQWDFYVGAFARYLCLDVAPKDKQAIGWQNEDFQFMNPYNGLINTDLAGKMNPWQVGIKIGVQWHYLKKEQHLPQTTFDYLTRQDTSYQYVTHTEDSVYIVLDTIRVAIGRQKTQRLMENNYSVLFAFDSYTLDKKMSNLLNEIANSLVDYPDQRIAIYGHTCDIGNKNYNQALSERRAQTVYNRLMERGVKASQIDVRGFGYERPADLDPNHDKSRDRRVEIIVVHTEEE